ncbi:MAG: 2-amino-4-hydroxy-6-hydroxymethyldihydropteridine diphosphokinase [Bacteroidales bacterium]|jgi:2-amino-4-hydroxy-6-hydroxymethyldihydropteridine diphosphokinase|nr:2-amino-4-hydroxy-6-hydroxymethyldihydropteridine diphosphokinase [Bacteroidales bacterium]
MMHKTWLLLGANEGNILQTFDEVRTLLNERVGEIVASSDIHTSEAWNMDSDTVFLNQALEINTFLQPLQVLDICKEIERILGRETSFDCGSNGSSHLRQSCEYQSRPIDIDIIFYDDIIYNNPRLFIPHPLAHIRQFVLRPLSDICPDKLHHVYGKTVQELLSSLQYC